VNKITKIILLYLGIVSLGACAASGVHVSEDQLSNLKEGQTTYGQVVGTLGNPTTKTRTPLGDTQIMYIYSEYQTRPETFIPYVGGFVGGADTRSNIVTLTFNKKGVLQNYSQSETAMGTASNLSSGVSMDRVSVKARN
jgi:outer membrane protein assembly factor BamE (lipoprotein component of BamABCDE complex)